MARKPRNTRPAKFVAPEMPPKTEAELEANRQITAGLQSLVAQLHQRNLENAVLLAQQAARGQGPVVQGGGT